MTNRDFEFEDRSKVLFASIEQEVVYKRKHVGSMNAAEKRGYA